MSPAAEGIEPITNSDARDMPTRRMRALADDDQFLGGVVYPGKTLEQMPTTDAHRETVFVERVRGLSCDKAAQEVNSRGGALLIWKDSNGEFRAQRISREHSVIREFVPAYLRRHSS